MSDAKQTLISDQFSELEDRVQALLKRAEAGEGRVRASKTREEAVRTDLSALPIAGAPLAIFLEVEGLAFTVDDTERAILNAGQLAPPDAANDAEPSPCDRAAALGKLVLPFSDALSVLALQDEFVVFCEQCCMRRVALTVCSRGFKPVLRHLLRRAGLGHVEVFGNDVAVGADGRWVTSFRDDSTSGHDKARSVRRALTTAVGGASIVVIGSSECDMVHRASSLPAQQAGRQTRRAGAMLAANGVVAKGSGEAACPHACVDSSERVFAPHSACAGFVEGGARSYGLCQAGVQVCSRLRCRRLLCATIPGVAGARQ
jgi:hypothetical protein